MLNETHLLEEINDAEIKINGFRIIRTDSHSNHTGGTCIYYKKPYKINKVKKYADNTMWITACEINIRNIDVIFAAVYISPSESKSVVNRKS